MNRSNVFMASLLSLSFSPVMASELSANFGATSDYRWRGQSLNAGDPALQAGINADFSNGLFLGAWASNLDYGGDESVETDFWLGYSNSLSADIDYSVSVISYQYPGSHDVAGFEELLLGLSGFGVDVSYYFTDDMSGLGDISHYISINYSYQIMEEYSIDLHAGRNWGNYWSNWDIGAYTDMSVGLSTRVMGIDLSLAYLFNDINTEMKVDSGVFRNDNHLLFSVNKSFDFTL
ncbi:TorF family putative porin [Shewanella sp.]|uniref:TorF family putative porin n=1 Tax=Shewanella sp. TaxID=50422 RepID=UPI001A49F992|nr:TorF family putative porin [Shewanella sp.]MBL4814430.1 hypothetical protein [Shewanella sp.]MCJ8305298.1 TorF family putative porin [Shewanella sp.]